MTPDPGIEPGPHWWEASALTTAPSLLLDTLYDSLMNKSIAGTPKIRVRPKKISFAHSLGLGLLTLHVEKITAMHITLKMIVNWKEAEKTRINVLTLLESPGYGVLP